MTEHVRHLPLAIIPKQLIWRKHYLKLDQQLLRSRESYYPKLGILELLKAAVILMFDLWNSVHELWKMTIITLQAKGVMGFLASSPLTVGSAICTSDSEVIAELIILDFFVLLVYAHFKFLIVLLHWSRSCSSPAPPCKEATTTVEGRLQSSFTFSSYIQMSRSESQQALKKFSRSL